MLKSKYLYKNDGQSVENGFFRGGNIQKTGPEVNHTDWKFFAELWKDDTGMVTEETDLYSMAGLRVFITAWDFMMCSGKLKDIKVNLQ